MDLNKVLLCGRLTRDLEIRYIGGGSAVCDLPLAVNNKYRRSDGETVEEVCYVDVTVWGKTAENCNQYLSKGSGVFVEGRLKLENWETQDGQKRSKHKVIADRVQFMPRGQGGGQGGSQGRGAQVDDYGDRYSSGSRGGSQPSGQGQPGGQDQPGGQGQPSEDRGSSGFGSGGSYHDENVPF